MSQTDFQTVQVILCDLEQLTSDIVGVERVILLDSPFGFSPSRTLSGAQNHLYHQQVTEV